MSLKNTYKAEKPVDIVRTVKLINEEIFSKKNGKIMWIDKKGIL